MSPTPLVSVHVTTYNHSRFVLECLESLRAQTFRDFEVIITDDASSDGTADIIEAWLARTSFPARFLRNRINRGICANRNTALSLTSAPFVCSLAGDDADEPDRLERQVAFFLTQPEEVAAIYGDMRLIDAQGKSLELFYRTSTEPPGDGWIFSRLLRRNFMPWPATMLRRSAIEAVGGHDESLAYEDYDMSLRLSHAFAFRYLPGAVVRYRVLTTSLSRAFGYRRALRESRLRILLSWSGRAGDGEAGLSKRIAFHQIALGHDREARQSLTRAALESGKAADRLLALLVRAPGACLAVRSLMRLRESILLARLATAFRRWRSACTLSARRPGS
jgi:glycosyltransferase involved in cell wall biosynthesis